MYKEGIEILEACVRAEPDNATYQWFLAIGYSERTYQNWTYIPPGGNLPSDYYATEKEHVEEAEYFIEKAEKLKFDDHELAKHIREMKENIRKNYERHFYGNWVVTGIWFLIALIGLFSGSGAGLLFSLFFGGTAGFYVFASRPPQFLINRKVIKGISPSGGFDGIIWVIAVYPFMAIWNFFNNYIRVGKIGPSSSYDAPPAATYAPPPPAAPPVEVPVVTERVEEPPPPPPPVSVPQDVPEVPPAVQSPTEVTSTVVPPTVSTPLQITAPSQQSVAQQTGKPAYTLTLDRNKILVGIIVIVLVVFCAIGFFVLNYYSTGTLAVASNPQEVQRIEVDGKEYLGEPMKLPRGEHKVFVKGTKGYQDGTSTITLKGGEKKEIYVSLDKMKQLEPTATEQTAVKLKGVIQNDDKGKYLYIVHPDTGLGLKIAPSQHLVIEVSLIPDSIEARYEGQKNSSNYTVFKKEGQFEGVDVAFGARIQSTNFTRMSNNIPIQKDGVAKSSGTNTSGKLRGVVVNENNKTLYLYHPDSGNQLTVRPGQYIILEVDRIPEQIKGVYDMSLSRQTSFNFKIHKKQGNYSGTQVEFGASVNDPGSGS